MKINRGKDLGLLTLFVFLLLPAQTSYASSPETEVRATVQQVFQQLRTKNYDALYDTLPAASRARISRQRFASELRRTQDMYVLDRLEIGKVNVSENIAVVDTVLYGTVLNTAGKIVVQQYLVREDEKWKVATGDRATMRRFLAANPGFAHKFHIRKPRVFVKKEGSWVEFTPPKPPARRK